MKRELAKFSELFQVKHGYAFKSKFFDSSGPYVLLTPGNFYEAGGFRDVGEKQKYYTGDVPDGFVLDESDLLIAMTEQAEGLLGSSAWVPNSGKYLHNQRLGKVIELDESKLDKRYLYYLLNTREVRHQISSSATGTKVRHTAPERIGRVEVELPPIDSQHRIADVLSAYDELIQSNRRRATLLEDGVGQLYREWFIRLRFPGHEHARIVKAVPDGWVKTTADCAMEVLSGGTPKTTVPDFWDGDIPFYTPKDATDACYVLETERSITELGLNNCNSRLYKPNTVFISARGTVGKLNLTEQPMAMSQSCYALIGKGHVSQLFLFCALKEAIEQFRQHAVGAVFDAIVVDTFKLIPFLVPDERHIRDFEELVSPMFRQILNLMEQNQKLAAARDLLLPRLMRGQIAV